MSGENINVYAAAFTLALSGAAVASGAVGQSTTPYDLVANGSSYPDATFALTCTFGGAPVENSVITLCAQLLGVDGGSKNTLAPEPSRLGRVIGNFVVDNIATEQTIALDAYDLPRNASYWLYNNATGQSLAVGWVLKVTPRTVKAAA
jgi:hypothetical protein